MRLRLLGDRRRLGAAAAAFRVGDLLLRAAGFLLGLAAARRRRFAGALLFAGDLLFLETERLLLDGDLFLETERLLLDGDLFLETERFGDAAALLGEVRLLGVAALFLEADLFLEVERLFDRDLDLDLRAAPLRDRLRRRLLAGAYGKITQKSVTQYQTCVASK